MNYSNFSIEKAKASVENLGGQFKGNYIFKDIIFVPRKKIYNLNEDFLRIRSYVKTNLLTKNVVLVRKKTEWKKQGKLDKIILKKEFDTEKEAFLFIEENLPDFEKGFEYRREGWQYELEKNKIFVENIEEYSPSIEIETNDEKDLQILFNKIGVKDLVRDSVPEIMRRILTKSSKE